MHAGWTEKITTLTQAGRNWLQRIHLAAGLQRVLLHGLFRTLLTVALTGLLIAFTARSLGTGDKPAAGIPHATSTDLAAQPAAGATAITETPLDEDALLFDLTATFEAGETITASANSSPQRSPTATWYIRSFPTRTPVIYPTRLPTWTRAPTLTRTRPPTRTVTQTFTLIPSYTPTKTPTNTFTSTITPTPRPDRIAFSADRDADGKPGVYTINADGSGLVTVVQEDTASLFCGWSPGGSWLLFEALRGDPARRQLYRIRPDGSYETLIPSQPGGENSQAAWSPAGNWIAFINQTDTRTALYVMRVNGGDPTLLVEDVSPASRPDWSRDGNTILFVSQGDIYSLNVAWLYSSPLATPVAATPQQLTTTVGEEASPRYSPDGLKVAFARLDDDRWQLYIVEGTNWASPAQPTQPANNHTPSWSRDGSKLLFISDLAGGSHIYTIPAGGGGALLLDTRLPDNQRPNWMP